MSQTTAQLIGDLVQPLGHADGTEGAPTLSFKDDEDTGLFRPGDNTLGLATGGSTRLTIDSSGRLLVGTSSNSAVDSFNSKLQIADTSFTASLAIRRDSENNGGPVIVLSKSRSATLNGNTVVQDTDNLGTIEFYGADGTNHHVAARIRGVVDGTPGNDDIPGSLTFALNSGGTGVTERLRIDSGGRLLVGTSSARSTFVNGTVTSQLQVEGTTFNRSCISIVRNADSTANGALILGKTRGAAVGDNGLVADNDVLGSLEFQGNDGTNMVRGAWIRTQVDGTAASDDMPGRMVFGTTASGNNNPTTRMTMLSNGNIGIGDFDDPNVRLEIRGDRNAVIRLTNERTTESGGQTLGRLEFFGSDTSGPGAGVRSSITARTAASDGTGSSLSFSTASSSTNNVEALRILENQKITIGTNTARATYCASSISPQVQIEGLGFSDSSISLTRNADSTGLPAFFFGKTRGTSVGANGIVADDDELGSLEFQGNDGSKMVRAAMIRGGVDGTPGSSDMPGRLVFYTTADGGTDPTTRVTIDSSGRLVVGSTGNSNSQEGSVESHSDGVTGTSTTVDLTNPAGFVAVESGNTANDVVGYWMNHGSLRAGIGSSRTATNNWGTDLRFYTHKTNASDQFEVYERMRILPDGDVLVGTTNSSAETISTGSGININADGTLVVTAQSNTTIYANRAGTDGVVIQIRHQGTAEGTISVSGSTVSYNGGHLSRWSQLPGGAERTEILRGSVLSNIDEMCEWGEEENEQLNRMKVSNVEGDKNVSGVFQAWDDDDDTYTNDFYCAMTGDFIIRIAQGVTVERGDLLMSAGDGTAKPQDDDIIRSKTIAKVTSTNVSCTYDDGSYCVPCVLMAC